MKSLTILLLLIAHLSLAQPQKGQAVPDLQFTTVLNAPVKTATLAQLKGKLVLIEFWATWCGPCLTAMPHLKQLQKKYGERLQVITVTDETPVRTQKYLTARPSNLWFAVDTAHALTRIFPHQLIPHTVLIGPDGKLIAQTEPQAVTEPVIDSLLRGQTVHLPEKTDNPMSVPEILKTYFDAADTVKSRFIMQAEIKGAPGVSTTHRNDSVFKNRRLTCLNVNLLTLYRIAYGDFSSKRIIDKTGTSDTAPSYCLDLIVPTPSELMPTLQNELASRFDVQAKVEPQVKEVNVLKITNQAKFNQISRNKSGQRTYSASHGAIDQQAITMQDFATYLEDYGTDKRLVVDETQNHEKLDIQFSFQPENPQSLTTILTDMGLTLVKESRNVDMLLLYK